MRIVMLNHPMATGSIRWFEVSREDESGETTADEIYQPQQGIQSGHFDESYNSIDGNTVHTVCCVYGPSNGVLMDTDKARKLSMDSSIMVGWNREKTIKAITKILDEEEKLMQECLVTDPTTGKQTDFAR